MEGLYQALTEYSTKDYYPMHMPGHKRNQQLLQMVNPYTIDITEIEGFDDLHQAEGILKELSDRLQKLYRSGRSYPLVNGSTVGILAGISAAASRGDRILVARNCHKAVYHSIYIRDLEPVYLYPECIPGTSINGGISASQVEKLLITYPGISLVVITSPTYEGIVSDIEAIAEIVHKAGALLLVDEAHGAHFGFHRAFPQSAVTQGADIVIQSLHKTLPSFTQTAVLHSNRAELNHRIEQYLSFYESSSPSYLLMAGVDRCVRMLEEHGDELFEEYYNKLQYFLAKVSDLRKLRLLSQDLGGTESVPALDPSKLTILLSDTALTGPELAGKLREDYHIVMELETRDYVLGMTSICDTQEGFERLAGALKSIDGELKETQRSFSPATYGYRPVQALWPHEAAELMSEEKQLSECVGRIAADFISIYPPGIPLLVPGEIIEDRLLQILTHAQEDGLKVTGLLGEQKDRIQVLGEDNNGKNLYHIRKELHGQGYHL